MPWLPVKKIRKQIKLLLLLVLLTCAAWLTYVHLSLVRQGRTLRQRLGYGRGREGRAPGRGGEASRGARPARQCWGRGRRSARPPSDVTSDERDPLGERPRIRADSGSGPEPAATGLVGERGASWKDLRTQALRAAISKHLVGPRSLHPWSW